MNGFALLERQPDVEADGLAAGLAGAAIGGFDAGSAARRRRTGGSQKERQAPGRQHGG
jgi:hypothetical protein